MNSEQECVKDFRIKFGLTVNDLITKTTVKAIRCRELYDRLIRRYGGKINQGFRLNSTQEKYNNILDFLISAERSYTVRKNNLDMISAENQNEKCLKT